MTAVIDSSAVMAVMFGEPGQERVHATLPGALLSTVNLAGCRIGAREIPK